VRLERHYIEVDEEIVSVSTDLDGLFNLLLFKTNNFKYILYYKEVCDEIVISILDFFSTLVYFYFKVFN